MNFLVFENVVEHCLHREGHSFVFFVVAYGK